MKQNVKKDQSISTPDEYQSISTLDEYKKLFDGDDPKGNLKIVKAYEFAVETRKFEIDLYWKRSVYYWTFIAAIFTGYFLTVSSEKETVNPYIP